MCVCAPVFLELLRAVAGPARPPSASSSVHLDIFPARKPAVRRGQCQPGRGCQPGSPGPTARAVRAAPELWPAGASLPSPSDGGLWMGG